MYMMELLATVKGGQEYLGRFFLRDGRVTYEAASSAERPTFERILKQPVKSAEGAIVSSRGNPEDWLFALPDNFTGAALRVRPRRLELPSRELGGPGSELSLRELRARRTPAELAAARWARENAASKVTNVTDEQRDTLRGMIAGALLIGRSEEALATAIGREVGLNDAQEDALTSFRERLLAAGTVVRAGDLEVRVPTQGLSAGQIRAWVARYERTLRRERGLAIASYELRAALNEGQRLLWIEQRGAGARRVWRLSPRHEVDDVCDELAGEVRRLDEPYELPDGTEIFGPPAHPHCMCDAPLFAPARRRNR